MVAAAAPVRKSSNPAFKIQQAILALYQLVECENAMDALGVKLETGEQQCELLNRLQNAIYADMKAGGSFRDTLTALPADAANGR